MTPAETKVLGECYEWLVEQVGEPHEQTSQEAAELLAAFERITLGQALPPTEAELTCVLDVLDWNANFAYAPPAKPHIVAKGEVQSVHPTDSRGPGPFTAVKMKNGEVLTCRGWYIDIGRRCGL